MEIGFYCFSALLVFASLVPLIQNQHWFFRIFDFGKVQILVLQLLVFIAAWFLLPKSTNFYIMQAALMGCMIYEMYLLYPYTPLYNIETKTKNQNSSKSISILSTNIYQFNKEYHRFLNLVNEVNPDIILTMESNQDWENALQPLKEQYPYFCEIALENTYGMHLYSKIEMTNCQKHYFMADDIPSIEAAFKTNDGFEFVFFGVHPPPPSPTEEENAKERDGELLAVAKKVKQNKKPTVVIGDFNNVAWAKSSVLFRKTSETIDPRIGRGFISTFHANYKLLRFPIDQMFHTTDIFVEKLKALQPIGSDHLPLYCSFFIDKINNDQEDLVEPIEKEDYEDINEMIEEGKNEESNRESVATE
ncbi:endonuclease/exonuclease/phosphatase family protein [Paenimyroides aestuarii]|uniref:Endonuclease/exonuclease/phosphatase family protein n=1 Tax=Paenimyroides aestuarii TaxID=2968490 RepID=A0ABY5NTG7_9FLAO|nr:endonuclease/exonuclease/phosphatase family protein [Paenimyroides aestuarii]UUV21878.1 endonuclease/exonuclease/phosphatase family protein [Paenimyroides aestuarii]